MKIFYNEQQNVLDSNSLSPSAGKPALVASQFSKFTGIEVVSNWDPLSVDEICKAHDPIYVLGVLKGFIVNGFSNRLETIAKSLPWTTGSFYRAAESALTEKIAISPTSGFHHACYSLAMGYCTFNGLMIAAILLKERNLVSNVGIIDFDLHWGNGTFDIIRKRKVDYVSHMAFSDQVGNNYDDWLNGLYSSLEKKFSDSDILFYQAGADAHIDDPFGGVLTTEQMRRRDNIVFKFAKDYNIPIVWNLAGGYQEPVDKIIQLHVNTLEESLKIF